MTKLVALHMTLALLLVALTMMPTASSLGGNNVFGVFRKRRRLVRGVQEKRCELASKLETDEKVTEALDCIARSTGRRRRAGNPVVIDDESPVSKWTRTIVESLPGNS